MKDENSQSGTTRRGFLQGLAYIVGGAVASKALPGCGSDAPGAHVVEDATVDPVGPERNVNYDNLRMGDLYFVVVEKTETGNGGSLESYITGNSNINNSTKHSFDPDSLVLELNEPTYFEDDSGNQVLESGHTLQSVVFDALQTPTVEYYNLDPNNPETEGRSNQIVMNTINGLHNNQEGARLDPNGTNYIGRLSDGTAYVALSLLDQDNNRVLGIAYAGGVPKGATTPLSHPKMNKVSDLTDRMQTTGF